MICLLSIVVLETRLNLKSKNFTTQMPSFLHGTQHTTQDSNSSRLFTKIRLVIESVNSRKKMEIFCKYNNKQKYKNIPLIEKDMKNIFDYKCLSAIIASNEDHDQISSIDLSKYTCNK